MSEREPDLSNGAQSDSPGEATPRLLSSWKEIAEFLGVTDRTAQEYEKSRGLPVKRIGRKVAVLESDLRAWQSTSLRASPWWARVRILQVWAVVATAAFLTTGITFVWFGLSVRSVGPPVTAAWYGNVLTAADASGRIVWHHSFNTSVDPNFSVSGQLRPWFGDLAGTGETHFITPYPHVNRESEGWPLVCLSGEGKVAWTLAPQRVVRNADRSFQPPYVLRSFRVFPSPEKDRTKWVAAVFVHHTHSPSILIVVDSHGRSRGEYWNPGHMQTVTSFDPQRNGLHQLLIGGVRHGDDQAMLLAFDPGNVHGTAHLSGRNKHLMLLDMPLGTEDKTILFPRSELNRADQQFNIVESIQILENRIQVSIYEHLTHPLGYIIYTVNMQLSGIQDIILTDSYLNAVRNLRDPKLAGWSPAKEAQSLKRGVRFVLPATAKPAPVNASQPLVGNPSLH